MRSRIILLFVLLAQITFAQGDARILYSSQIDTLDLMKYVYHLASEEMEGRKTGTVGLERSAGYIKDQFESIGLKSLSNFYRQPFDLIKSSPGIKLIEVNNKALINGKDYLFEGEMNMKINKETTLYILSKDQLEKADNSTVEGKVVAFVRLDDPFENYEVYNKLIKLRPALIIQILKDQSLESYVNDTQSSGERASYLSLDPATKEGFGNLYMDMKRLIELTGYNRDRLLEGGISTGFKYLIKRETEIVSTSNIIGVIEGEDESNGVVVLSAHYDHEGIKAGKIYPGADDNASGIASLLEVAQAFKEAKEAGVRLKKTLLFVAFGAEEDGLLGSEYFMRNLPYPLEQIEVNLNIDMIGRVSPEYEDFEDYVYLLGSERVSAQLHEISENVNEAFTGLTLDYSFDVPNHSLRVFQRGDQWSFAKHGIPAIFYFGGTHDDYHRPTDTAEKINYRALRKRSHLIFQTAWSIVIMDERLIVDSEQ